MKLNFHETKLNFENSEVKQKKAKKALVFKSLNEKLNFKKCEVKLQVFLQYRPPMKYKEVRYLLTECLERMKHKVRVNHYTLRSMNSLG